MKATHKQVEGALIDFMASEGYTKVKIMGLLTDKRFGGLYPIRVDKAFWRLNHPLILCEVKPAGITGSEMNSGLGQALEFLMFDAVSYLVLFEEDYRRKEYLFKKHSPFGVLTYNIDFSEWFLRKRATRGTGETVKFKVRLSGETFLKFLRHMYLGGLADGGNDSSRIADVPLDLLEQEFEQYPMVRPYRGTLVRELKKLGIEPYNVDGRLWIPL